jgi:DNA modification methylase
VSVRVLHGDCVDLMRGMPDCSVDSIVTDPPYELGFMGKRWDAAGIAYSLELWAEALRVLKPGGHLLAFGGTRTYHRMACAIEDAGFEIRDSIHWTYSTGFPKSLNIGKAIDKAAGAERKVVGSKRVSPKGISAAETRSATAAGSFGGEAKDVPVTAPATDDAARWEGWGTALKPAHEPIVVARKPLRGTVAGNVLVWGTGGLNIDGCRVPGAVGDGVWHGRTAKRGYDGGWDSTDKPNTEPHAAGRWPANVVFDRTAGEALDQQSGITKDGVTVLQNRKREYNATSYMITDSREGNRGYGGGGGASRFFTQADFGPDDWPFVYQAKPSRKERNAGLDGLDPKRDADRVSDSGVGGNNPRNRSNTPKTNHHPTVKPVALMRHLVRLVTPPGGTVLDPFAGSGTTLVAAMLEGFDAVGCEMTDEYLPIIAGRVAWAEEQAAARSAEQARLL